VSSRSDRHVIAAACGFEVIERVDLPGHFEVAAIDRIVPAFDVDAARPAGQAKLGKDVGPVAVTKAGRAHEDKRMLAENAVFLDHLPANGGVLAMHMENLVR